MTLTLILAALAAASPGGERTPPLIPYTDEDRPSSLSGGARDEQAFARKEAVVRRLFADAGVDFPPAQLLLRAFKEERQLEVWASGARSGPLTHVATYEVCYSSGGMGPKRRQGDMQVPEGFYHLDYFNRNSNFHLSFRVAYPNESDRILGVRGNLGGDIMIHGSCVSIGCLAMSDERIEELWVMTRSLDRLKRRVFVHIFPTRDLAGLLEKEPDHRHAAFWRNLLEGLAWFDGKKTLPKITVDRAGVYHFREP